MITQRLSEDFGMEVSLSGVRFYPIKELVVNDLLIKDQSNDTLVYCKKLSVYIDSLQLKDKHLYIGHILLTDLKTQLNKQQELTNFQFIIDSLNSRQKSTSLWKYSFNKLQIKNGFVSFHDKEAVITPKIFNSEDVKLQKINIQIDKIKSLKDSLSFRIKNLSFTEKSGFSIKKTYALAGIGTKGLRIKNLKLRTNNSTLNVNYLNIFYDTITDFYSLNNKVRFDLKLNALYANHKDFKYFSANSPSLKHEVFVNGNLNGTVNNLKGRNLKIKAGSETELITNFDINDISDFENCFLYLDIKKLKTSIVDISKIISLNKETQEFELPESFKEMGKINYSGNLSGFINNLVAYGIFKTDIGSIKTDIGFKFTKDKRLIYSGYLNTQNLNIGKLLNSDQNLTKVTMDVSVHGYRSANKNFNSYINGTVDSIFYNNYKYEKIILNGLFSNKKFDGWVALSDPNAQVEFNGKMDFNNEVPDFDFTAVLENVNTNKLNLTKNIPDCKFSLKMSSKLSGKNLNTINGDLKLYDGEFITKNKKINLDTLVINAINNDSINQIELISDVADAKISGKYFLSSIGKEFKTEISHYAPAFFNTNKDNDLHKSDVSFSLKTKNLSEFIETIYPQIIIADSSMLEGIFNRSKNEINVKGNFAKLKIKSIDADFLDFNIQTKNDHIVSEIKSNFLTIANFLPFKNFELSNKVANNKMDVNLIWNNEVKNNSGNISTQTIFKRALNNNLYGSVFIKPSSVTLNDSVWNIQESSVHFSPEGMKIDAFRIYHLGQEINANGSLHNYGKNKLETYFQNINLNDISSILNINKLSLNGLLNGNINFTGEYKNPIITNNIEIKDFKVNNDNVGNLNINSFWNKENKAIEIMAIAKKSGYTSLNGKGYIKPKERDFDFQFDLDSLPIGFLNLYLNNVVQNLRGNASGILTLNNNDDQINLEGKLNLNESTMDVDLLNCQFSLQDSVILTKNSIEFNNMTLSDSKGNSGIFSGNINHTNFFDMSYNLYARANNMLVLNTSIENNPVYYGTVYATGDLSINGVTDFLEIDINAKSEKNTKLYIPMSDKQESLDNRFIQFVNKDTSLGSQKNEVFEIEDYQVDLANFAINMGLEITPEAQVQVIFDPTVGDILRSSGSGNLQIQMNKEGNVYFFGEYTADEGEYLFSLENVVNKRFDINKGGSVVWKGNPYDATIDITTTYKLKTSIQPLIIPSSQNTSNTESYRRIPINCNMILSGQLAQPNIKFNITAPTMEQSTQTLIADAISTDEELNRQVLSLLILNKFFTPDFYANTGRDRNVNTAAITNTSEMLSSQLSSWLSQISNDFDVGISYRPEDEISSEQIEVALSTQIFNDRVSINGNVEYGKYNTTQQNTSNIVGDFDLDVKLNKSGNLRAKAYTHSNDDYSYDSSPTTQGVGISYQEDFDTVGELLRKYWNWITGKGKKEKEVEIIEERKKEKEK